ncbi:hypothetical protein ACFY5F_45895 [Streptomyces sp. NPDC013161]|uniref:hypothetical protein n=1 Tax=Streptomyces sp. NPDC013161 TaxID=3364862 RepID=UPI00368A09A2
MTTTRGTTRVFFNSLRKKRLAAALSRRFCTRMSRTLPSCALRRRGADDPRRGRPPHRKLREELRLIRLLPRVIHDIQALLTPPGADTDDDTTERQDVRMVHLWDPTTGVLPAGVNYAPDGG